MKLKSETYSAKKQILATLGHWEAEKILINNEGIEANAQGKKIIPAGTIIGKQGESIFAEGVVASIVNDSNAQGIVKEDIDVTEGQNIGTAYYVGNIKESALPLGPSLEAKKALSRITFK